MSYHRPLFTTPTAPQSATRTTPLGFWLTWYAAAVPFLTLLIVRYGMHHHNVPWFSHVVIIGATLVSLLVLSRLLVLPGANALFAQTHVAAPVQTRVVPTPALPAVRMTPPHCPAHGREMQQVGPDRWACTFHLHGHTCDYAVTWDGPGTGPVVPLCPEHAHPMHAAPGAQFWFCLEPHGTGSCGRVVESWTL